MFFVHPMINYETENKKNLEWAIFVLQRKKNYETIGYRTRTRNSWGIHQQINVR